MPKIAAHLLLFPEYNEHLLFDVALLLVSDTNEHQQRLNKINSKSIMWVDRSVAVGGWLIA